MTDTTPVTTAIATMIRAGTSGQELLAAISARFPELSPTELSEALQAGTEVAERKMWRKRMLTPDEVQRVQRLRQEAKETHAYYQETFAHLRPDARK
jgi:uncharacterized protein (DUF433 family)